jgi:hypothetical protein
VLLSKGSFTPSSGLSAAYTLCDGEKPASVTGPVVALLATSARSAKSLVAGSYVRADGITIDVSGAFGDLADSAGIWVHADGSYAAPPIDGTPLRVWNGAQGFAAAPPVVGHTCGDWSATAGMGDVGYVTAGALAWGAAKASCSTPLPIYCVEK